MLATSMIDAHPSSLSKIYQDKVSMAVWQRQLDTKVSEYAQTLTNMPGCFQTRFIQSSKHMAEQLEKELPMNHGREAFIDDVTLVVDMFSCLFDLDAVGLRIAVLNSAMCPKFHVDQVPCRLICTYAGTATQWHPHKEVQRFEDGTLAPLPDTTPHTLRAGDVALLKGEAWEGNERRGLVHRSPSATDRNRRLVLTLDFS